MTQQDIQIDLDSVATESEIEIEWDGRRLKPYGKSCRMAYTIQQMAKLLDEPCYCRGPFMDNVCMNPCEQCRRKVAILRHYKGASSHTDILLLCQHVLGREQR